MEDVAQHKKRSAEDEEAAEKTSKALPYSPWVLVMRFYAALHITQAYLLTKNERFEARRHHEREKAIRASPELNKTPKFRTAYRWLQDTSEQARYDPGLQIPESYFERSEEYLATVRSFLQSKVDRYLEE